MRPQDTSRHVCGNSTGYFKPKHDFFLYLLINQTICTVLSPHEKENLTLRNVKFLSVLWFAEMYISKQGLQLSVLCYVMLYVTMLCLCCGLVRFRHKTHLVRVRNIRGSVALNTIKNVISLLLLTWLYKMSQSQVISH